MNKNNFFDTLTRKFLLGESNKPDGMSYIESIREILENIKPTTKSDRNRVAIAKNHIMEVRRAYRRLNERISLLEEQLTILEEKRKK